MTYLYLLLRSWLERDDGQDLAEYALLLGFLAVVALAAVAFLGDQMPVFFEQFGRQIAAWVSGGT